MVPSPNPVRWDMGWGAALTAIIGVGTYMEWDKKLGISGYVVVCQQDKTDEEIYYEMLTKKLEMERHRIYREVQQPILTNVWEILKAEWRMWLFPRMEADVEKLKRPIWRPLNELRPDLYDTTKREKLIYEMELLKKMGHMSIGSAGGDQDRSLDDYIKQLREDFREVPKPDDDEEKQPSVEDLKRDRAESTRIAAKQSAQVRVFYEPKDAEPRAVI